VSENVVECASEPEVAVTVTVEVTGAGVDAPPPHPPRKPNPAALTASSIKNSNRRRFLHPRQQIASARVVPGSSEFDLWRSAAVVAAVVRVTVAEVAPGGVTLAGEKLQEAPAGKPDEQLKVTAEANAPCVANEIVAVPLAPAATDIDAGATATVKSGGILMM
jgi:hypothetical protein